MNRFNFIAEGFKGFVRNGVRSAASVLILGSSHFADRNFYYADCNDKSKYKQY